MNQNILYYDKGPLAEALAGKIITILLNINRY